MSQTLEVAARLYTALHDRDVPALVALLHADFTATVSTGMPYDVGGRVTGPRAMIEGVWGVIAQHFDVTPEPDGMLPVAEDRVVVLGHYRGRAHVSGRTFEASFAHDLRVRGSELLALTQITDTACWYAALVPSDVAVAS